MIVRAHTYIIPSQGAKGQDSEWNVDDWVFHLFINMPPFKYPLPTTAAQALGGGLFIDPQASHTTNLADATLARTKLHIALDAAQNGEAALPVVDVSCSAMSHQSTCRQLTP